MKNKTNKIPRVNIYTCFAFASLVVTYIQGIPIPNPRIRPTATARPIV